MTVVSETICVDRIHVQAVLDGSRSQEPQYAVEAAATGQIEPCKHWCCIREEEENDVRQKWSKWNTESLKASSQSIHIQKVLVYQLIPLHTHYAAIEQHVSVHVWYEWPLTTSLELMRVPTLCPCVCAFGHGYVLVCVHLTLT